jgi:hypothetical protein
MRVAAITMVYNESYFLPIWLRYYSSQVGPESVYVIDHGSSDGSVDPNSCNRIRIPRSDLDEVARAQMVSRFHAALLSSFDVVIYTDVDEFIVPRPSKYAGLVDYCRSRTCSVSRCVGIDVFQHDNSLPELDVNSPILRQRPYGHFSYWASKPLVSAQPIDWTPGFHACDREAKLDTDLALFHLKFADLTHTLDRLAITRGLSWSDTALQQGHSRSHRVSDEQMKDLIERRQRTRSDKDMDSIQFEKSFEARVESPLVRITEEYLQAL